MLYDQSTSTIVSGQRTLIKLHTTKTLQNILKQLRQSAVERNVELSLKYYFKPSSTFVSTFIKSLPLVAFQMISDDFIIALIENLG